MSPAPEIKTMTVAISDIHAPTPMHANVPVTVCANAKSPGLPGTWQTGAAGASAVDADEQRAGRGVGAHRA
ncbi:hypothetical protein GCM10010271_71290 [Streptomyces kurssanovii]|nr:hypothetical protein GCM10010271_71290 [Streptomyces kurssanovii]